MKAGSISHILQKIEFKVRSNKKLESELRKIEASCSSVGSQRGLQ